MTFPEKFLFDTVFDEETQVREKKKKKPKEPALVHTERDLLEALEQARKETHVAGFAEGREAGIKEVRDATETHTARALEAISTALPALMELRQSITRESHKKATALALQIARKLADEILKQYPVDQLTRMIADALNEIGGSVDKDILVRVNPQLIDALTPQINELRTRSEAAGKLTLIPDSTLEEDSCRVEWPEGGADHDHSSLAAEIDAAVHRYLNMIEDLPEFHGKNAASGHAPRVDEPGLASDLDDIANPITMPKEADKIGTKRTDSPEQTPDPEPVQTLEPAVEELKNVEPHDKMTDEDDPVITLDAEQHINLDPATNPAENDD